MKLGGEKMGFGPLFWFGLDWNWYSSGPIGVLSNFALHLLYSEMYQYEKSPNFSIDIFWPNQKQYI